MGFEPRGLIEAYAYGWIYLNKLYSKDMPMCFKAEIPDIKMSTIICNLVFSVYKSNYNHWCKPEGAHGEEGP